MLSFFVNAQEVPLKNQPPALKKGDTIAIVAPAGILKIKKRPSKKQKTLLESWGLERYLGEKIFSPK